jgi:hypothetical protein
MEWQYLGVKKALGRKLRKNQEKENGRIRKEINVYEKKRRISK